MKRYEVIQFLIDKYRLRSYLEIGVQNGDTFSRIKIEKKIGVDPRSNFPKQVLKQSSNQFFQRNREVFDLIFVDGDHHEEQVLADLQNSLAAIHAKGFVVAHDTLPKNLTYTSPNWCGLAFRAIQQVNQDPNVSLLTVDDDHGISILSLEPSAPGPLRKDYFDFFDNRVECLNLIPASELVKSKFYGV